MLSVDLLCGWVSSELVESPVTPRPDTSYLVWGQSESSGLIVIHRSELNLGVLHGQCVSGQDIGLTLSPLVCPLPPSSLAPG